MKMTRRRSQFSRSLVMATRPAAIVLAAVLTLLPSRSFADEDRALNAALADVCNRQIVLLGEEAAHGSGESLAFKTELVTRLIQECGFDAVYFEASFYEFQHLNRKARRREPLSTADIGAAVGGLWARDQEFAPLLPILLEGLQSGRLTLGGIDDQLGVAGARYANDAMMDEVVSHLQSVDRPMCRERLRRHVYSSYTVQQPYDTAQQAALVECVSKVRAVLPAGSGSDGLTLAELDSIERSLSRGLLTRTERFAARDRSMYENFSWMHRQLRSGARVIVWGATVHMARDGRVAGVSGDAPIFGEWIHQNTDADVFSLGFAAAGGSYRRPGTADPVEIGPVSADALEGQVLIDEAFSSIYLDKEKLARFGEIDAGVFYYEPVTANWGQILDGLVVFREERPPARIVATAR